jgi:hypothetical protein
MDGEIKAILGVGTGGIPFVGTHVGIRVRVHAFLWEMSVIKKMGGLSKQKGALQGCSLWRAEQMGWSEIAQLFLLIAAALPMLWFL